MQMSIGPGRERMQYVKDMKPWKLLIMKPWKIFIDNRLISPQHLWERCLQLTYLKMLGTRQENVWCWPVCMRISSHYELLVRLLCRLRHMPFHHLYANTSCGLLDIDFVELQGSADLKREYGNWNRFTNISCLLLQMQLPSLNAHFPCIFHEEYHISISFYPANHCGAMDTSHMIIWEW